MSGFISKYNGEEIEELLDKSNSIEVGLSEDVSAEPFNTITINGITYKIPRGQQLGLYRHTISFSIHVSAGGDSSNNVSLDGGDNIVSFDIFTTSSASLTLYNVFDNAKTLCFSEIVYNKRTSPQTINYAIMIGWASYSGVANKITFLYKTANTSRLDSITEFYARDFSDTVVEVIAN